MKIGFLLEKFRFRVASTKGIVLLASLFLASTVFSNPSLNNVSSGQVSIQQSPNSTVINQSSQKAILNWNSFNIGAQESTHFQQPAGGVALNRISPNQGSSQIYGRLTATGQIILINPAGLFFGPGAYVNVGGLVASTADITDQNFLSGGPYHFTQSPDYPNSSIINQGQIIAAQHGLIAVVAPNVINNGLIEANLGTVALGTGSAFTINFDGNGLINFAVDAKAANGGSINNTGTLRANGGKVIVSAKAASGVLDSVINMGGVVEAKSFGVKNGEIIFSGDPQGGVVKVTGKVYASGRNPGERGGRVKITGHRVHVAQPAVIDVSGDQGGGDIEIGGSYQGKGPLPNADATVVEKGTQLLADATTSGNGGNIIVWSDNVTKSYGDISARGGATGGDGGFVETSSHNFLDVSNMAVDLSAPHGATGTWLLDPSNVTITKNTDANGSFNGSDPNVFKPSADNSQISATTLDANLELANVTITTANAGGTQLGDITVGFKVNWASANTLLLQADNNIFINADISAPLGTLALQAGTPTNTITTDANGTISVFNFNLIRGQWTQIADPLPSFVVANNFQIASGAALPSGSQAQFIRALSGPPSGPYLIADIYGLQGIASTATTLATSYTLNNDIDASTTANWNSGAGFVPIGSDTPFSGTFNGNNHVISNLVINRPASVFDVGFFGDADGATIQNIGLRNATVTGPSSSALIHGILVGYAGPTTATNISNSYVADSTITVGDGFVGGLVGALDNASNLTGSYTKNVVVNGDSTAFFGSIGGLVGAATGSSTISNSYSSGLINVTNASATPAVGGFVGGQFSGSILNSYTTTAINNTSNGYLGGFAGVAGGDITNSYAAGAVMDNGGIATGVGGFAGLGAPTGSNNFWNTETTGQLTTVDAISTGINTAQMMSQSTFTGWDFSTVWNIIEGQSFPYLRDIYSSIPRAISGNSGTLGAQQITLATNGTVLTSAYTGANSFYYFLEAKDVIADASALLLYINNGANVGDAVDIAPANGGSLSGVSSELDIGTNFVSAGGSAASTLSNAILGTAKGSLVDPDILYSVSSGNLTLSNNIAFQSNLNTTYLLDGNINTSNAGIFFSGPVTLTSSPTLTTTGAVNGLIYFLGSLDSDATPISRSLTLNSPANVILTSVGATNPLFNLTTDAGGTVQIENPASITVANNLTFNEDVTLVNDTSLNVGNVLTIPGNITGSSGQAFSVSNGGTSTISGIIGANITDFTKAGAGALTLSGNNTYTGTTLINAGTLIAANNNALGTIAGGTTVTDGATLNLNNVTIGNEAMTISGQGVGGNGALTGTGTSSLSGGITLGNSIRIGGAGDLTLSGIISDSSNNFGIAKFGAGTLTLSGANTYTGTTSVLEGTLKIGAANALPVTTNLTVNGTTFNLNGFDQTVAGLNGDAAGVITSTGGAATLIINNTGTDSYAGFLVNTLSLTKDGSGTLTLTNPNSSYSGVTTILGGTLAVSKLSLGGINSSIGKAVSSISLGSLAAPTLSYIGTGDTTNRTISQDIIGGTGTIQNAGSGLLTLSGNILPTTGQIRFDTNTADIDVSGIIGPGTGTITKIGTQTLTLSGVNTYSGNTIISGGVLAAQNNSALSTGTATVNSGGTLRIDNGIAITNALSLKGNGSSGQGALVGNGANTAANGAITLAAASTIGTLSASDVFTLGTVNGPQALTISGPGAVTFGSAVGGGTALTSITANSSVNINGGSVTTSGAAGQNYVGAVILGANATLNAGVGDISFGSTLNSSGVARTLDVNSTGTTTFTGSVGNNLALASLTTNAGGTTAINGGSVTTTGTQTYNDAVVLGSNTALNTTNSLVDLLSTIDRDATARTLTVSAGSGAINIGGAVGMGVNGALGSIVLNSTNTTTLGAPIHSRTITTNAGGTTAINTTDITTSGNMSPITIGQLYNDNVILGANAVLNTGVGLNSVDFLGTLNSPGNFGLTVTTTAGSLVFGNNVGLVNPLSFIDISSAGSAVATSGANISVITNGALGQHYGGAGSLFADTTFNAGVGPVFFGSFITSNGGSHSLAINSSGTTTLSSSVGVGGAFTSIATDAAGNTILGGNVTTNGALGQSFADPVTLANNVTFNSSAGNGPVSFGSTVDGPFNLTVNSGNGAVGFTGAVGTAGSFGNLSSIGAGTVTFNNVVGNAGNRIAQVAITGPTNINGGSIFTSGSQTYTGAATLGAATTLDSGASALANIGLGVVNGGGFSLALNNAGTTTLGGVVSGLSSLTTNAGGTTAINGGSVTTTGIQTYNDAVVLGSNTALNTTNSLVDLLSTIDRDATARTLTVSAGSGAINVGGAVGMGVNGALGDIVLNSTNTTTLGAPIHSRTIMTNGGGTTAINTTDITTSANIAPGIGQWYGDNVTLGANAVLNAGVGINSIDFFGTLDSPGNFGLTATTSGSLVFVSNVGLANPLSFIDLTSAGGAVSISGANVITNGALGQHYSGGGLFNADTTLNAGVGPVFFGNFIRSNLGSHSLAINSSGTTTLSSSVGVGGAFTSIATDAAGNTILGGNVTTNGALGQSFADPVTLANNVTFNSSAANGPVSFGSTVDGPFNLTVNSGNGAVGFTGAVGTAGSFGNLSSIGAGTVTFNNVIGNAGNRIAQVAITGPTNMNGGSIFTSGSQTYTGAVTLGASTNINSGNGAVSFSNTVDGPFDLTLNSNGAVGFTGAVGTAGGFGNLSSLGAGTVTFNNVVGNAGNRIAQVAITGPTNINGGSIFTSGSQSYTGSLTLGAATTLDTGASALANIGLGAINGGGFSLDLNNAGTTTFSGNASGLASLTTNALGATAIGADITSSGNQTYNDPVSLANNAVLTSTNGDVIMNSSVNGGGNALTINNAGVGTTITGVVSNLSALTKNGLGTFTLSNSNTYTGATILNTGVLVASNAINPFGTGALNLIGGTILSTIGGGSTFANNLVVAGNPSIGGSNDMTFNGTGALNSGTLSNNNTAVTRLNGNLSGSGNLAQNAGTLILAGNNTGLTGSISLNGGVLSVANNQGLGNSAISINNGTTLGLTAVTLNNALTLNNGTLAIDGASALNSGLVLGLGSANTIISNLGASFAMNNSIIGSGALTLQGPGSFALNGTTDISSLTVNSDLSVNGAVNTSANQTYNNPVTLAGNSSFSASNVNMNNTLDGPFNANITSSGFTNINADVGMGTRLASLTINAPTINVNATNIGTNGGQDYIGRINLGVDSAFTVTGAGDQTLRLRNGVQGPHTLALSGSASTTETFMISGAVSNTSVAVDGQGGGNDTLAIDSGIQTWNINGVDGGVVSMSGSSTPITFTSIQNLSGGNNTDNFNVVGTLGGNINAGPGNDSVRLASAGSVGGHVYGGLGDDSIMARPNVPNTWTISGPNSGAVTGIGAGYSEIENLFGGNSGNTFVFQGGGAVSGLLSGGALTSENTIDYRPYPVPMTVTLTALNDGYADAGANRFVNFRSINNLIADDVMDNTLMFPTGKPNNIVITGAKKGFFNDPTSFTGFTTFVGSPGDTLTLPAGFSRDGTKVFVNGQQMNFDGFTFDEPRPLFLDVASIIQQPPTNAESDPNSEAADWVIVNASLDKNLNDILKSTKKAFDTNLDKIKINPYCSVGGTASL